MKNIIVFFMCLYLINPTNAQIVFEEDFEDSAAACPDICSSWGSIDQFTCLEKWAVSHGTPHYVNDTSNNSFITIASNFVNEGQGEGVYSIGIPELITGKTYKICLNYTMSSMGVGSTEGVLNVLLTNFSDMEHNSGSNGNCVDPPPSYLNQEIISQTVSNLGGVWSSIEQTFVFEGNQIPCLWIYSTSNVDMDLSMDNIRIFEVSTEDCPSDIIVDSPISLGVAPGVYQAVNKIEYGTNNTTGQIEPESEGTVVFRAGENIVLKPNFHANPNFPGQFYAYIAPCVGEEQESCGGNEMRSMTVSESTIRGEQGRENSSFTSKSDSNGGLLNSELKIIPNPNQGEFNILIPDSFSNNENVNISIYNSLGEMVSTFNNITDESLSVNGLSQGVYTVVLNHDNNSKQLTQRVVVVGR